MALGFHVSGWEGKCSCLPRKMVAQDAALMLRQVHRKTGKDGQNGDGRTRHGQFLSWFGPFACAFWRF